MTICYSGKSRISAEAIRDEDNNITLNRGSRGDVNWGRYRANTELNPDISNATNKRTMRQLFKLRGVPTPDYLTIQEAYERVNRGVPVVGRPDQHSKGRGYWACQTVAQVQKALRGTRKKKAATHFIEYIPRERAPREYRVHIFKGKSIRISQKQFDPDGRYVTIKPEHNVRHVRQAAKDAVEALELDFGAVDILANDTECWVLEVNCAPGLGGSTPRLWADTFNRWFDGGL